jgi:hypothetical protein
MTQSTLTENQDQDSNLLKDEFKKTTVYILLLSLLTLGMVGINNMVNSTYRVDAFPIFLMFMLMIIPTIESVFIRLGNVIAGHKFYTAWLIYPITNITILIGCVMYLYMKHANLFTFENVGFFIACLMGSMIFIHTAVTVRREEPKHYADSLKSNFDSKIVYMNKRACLVYRLSFGTLTFLSMFLLRCIFN